MQHVYRIKPTSISDLKAVAEDFVECSNPVIIRKAFASAWTRFEMVKENGGRFQRKILNLLWMEITDFVIFVYYL